MLLVVVFLARYLQFTSWTGTSLNVLRAKLQNNQYLKIAFNKSGKLGI